MLAAGSCLASSLILNVTLRLRSFESVTAVLFVVALSEFDQTLFEDGSTNRMVEALELFGEICNSRWFRKTAMILFLNKSDLFRAKIQSVDFSKYYPDFVGDSRDFEQTSTYLRELFLSRNETPGKRSIYPHITCATDTKNVDFTFLAVKDIIVKQGLLHSGLVTVRHAASLQSHRACSVANICGMVGVGVRNASS